MSGHHHHGHHEEHDGTGGAVLVTATVNVLLCAAKWTAFLITGSPSLFGEAAHSSADSLNPLFLWIGHRRGQAPADDAHPKGHGRETFFWSLIAAQMMFLIGSVLTAMNGWETIRGGRVPTPSLIALGIMFFAFFAEGYSFFRAWRELKKELGEDAVSKVTGSSNPLLLGILVENGVDMLAALFALLGFGIYQLTGNYLWDAGFSFAIAATIAVSTTFLMNRNRSLLVGESAPPRVVKRILRAARLPLPVGSVRSVTAVLVDTKHLSCTVHVALDELWFEEEWQDRLAAKPDLRDPTGWTLHAIVDAIERVKKEIRQEVPEVTEINVEIDTY